MLGCRGCRAERTWWRQEGGPWLPAPQWARQGASGDPIGLGVLQTFRGTDGVPCRWGAEVIQTNGGLGALVGAKALQAEPLRGQPW